MAPNQPCQCSNSIERTQFLVLFPSCEEVFLVPLVCLLSGGDMPAGPSCLQKAHSEKVGPPCPRTLIACADWPYGQSCGT